MILSRRLVAAVLLVMAGLATPAAADPSFDCSRASSPDEKAICADPDLAKADVLVARSYKSFTPEFQSKKAVAKAYLGDRTACGSDKLCILAAQYAALQAYGADEPWIGNQVKASLSRRAADMGGAGRDSPDVPGVLGQCVRTRLSSITTRFGEALTHDNEDMGTALGYANGIDLVSYERDPFFYDEKPGSPIIVCLMSIPHDCPAGDERGRFYYSYDPRTKAEWTLADSQHMCGGA